MQKEGQSFLPFFGAIRQEHGIFGAMLVPAGK
jgi:hypothetical protein